MLLGIIIGTFIGAFLRTDANRKAGSDESAFYYVNIYATGFLFPLKMTASMPGPT